MSFDSRGGGGGSTMDKDGPGESEKAAELVKDSAGPWRLCRQINT